LAQKGPRIHSGDDSLSIINSVEVQMQLRHSPIERPRHRRIEHDPLHVGTQPSAERRKSLSGRNEATDLCHQLIKRSHAPTLNATT